ncbi:unnamed protein product [Prorocentrum cordatum]|uniref:Uncharacterized protein n=1 Tax=Prorocentrum cordatum TaxID=2364126 RepID=A0ABN9SR31_9DINO|nr:unnamed protein product [Polarella glacialis]
MTEASQLLESYFIVDELESWRREWICSHCKEFAGKQFAAFATQRPLHRCMGISENGDRPSCKPRVSASAPLSARPRVCELHGHPPLPDSLQAAPTQSGDAQKQLMFPAVLEPSLHENLHGSVDQCSNVKSGPIFLEEECSNIVKQ